MIVFYLGNPVLKRKKLKSEKDSVYLDNDEVIACYLKNNAYNFVVCKDCYGDFTVLEYLSYNKSLQLNRPLNTKEANELISRLGIKINVNRKIKKLDYFEKKLVKLAGLMRTDTVNLCLNFDGLKYSGDKAKKLKRMLKKLENYNIYISVSDYRFIQSGVSVEWIAEEGVRRGRIRIKKVGRKATSLCAESC